MCVCENHGDQILSLSLQRKIVDLLIRFHSSFKQNINTLNKIILTIFSKIFRKNVEEY